MDESHARVIAAAIARTGMHHRRNGLVSGVAALLGCGLTLYVDFAAQKAASLALTVFFAIASYRAIRLANRYVDPSASPVLDALARDPTEIARVAVEEPPRSLLSKLMGGAQSVVHVAVDHRAGDRLWLRIEGGTEASAPSDELKAVFDAFAAVAPEAEIERQLR